MAARPVRIGIVGAGAIGSALAARIALAGQPVSVVARGARKDCLLSHGLRIRELDGIRVVRPAVIDLPALADADVVIVSVKAQALPTLLPQLASAMAPSSLLMPAVNGLPWWYFHGEGPLAGTVLRSVDPSADMFGLFDPHRLIGCVVYSRASIDDTGEVIVHGPQHLKVGRLADGPSLSTLRDQLMETGISVSIEHNIRREIWRKLARNASTNLVSGLTGATLGQIGGDSGLLEIVHGIAREVVGLSERLDCPADVDLDMLVDEIRQAGPFVTSTLQDINAGRAPELGALAEAPLELSQLVRLPMPILRNTYTLLRARLQYRAARG